MSLIDLTQDLFGATGPIHKAFTERNQQQLFNSAAA